MTKPLNKFRKSLRSKAKAAREPVVTIARVGHDPETLRRVARELKNRDHYLALLCVPKDGSVRAELRQWATGFTREARAAARARR